jgi:hypothetical protein
MYQQFSLLTSTSILFQPKAGLLIALALDLRFEAVSQLPLNQKLDAGKPE